jgi:AraC family transcriptional regulator
MNAGNKYLVEEYRGRINRVMDHIERNMERAFTLDELASVANFSKFHFSRIFWAMTGETPFEFLNRIRMEKAASLLVMNPKETISEIASVCGFANLPVFSRNFKMYFKMSPTQWRERYLGSSEGLTQFHSNSGQTGRNSGKQDRNPGQPESNHNKSIPSSGEYISWQVEPLKWKTNMELNKGVEVKELPKTTVAYVRHTGPYKGDEKLFEKLYGELFAWAGPRNLASQPDLKTFNIYHDDPGVTEEGKLRLSVGLNVPTETKVDGKIGKMDLEGGKYVVARFELGPMDYEKAWSWLFGEWFPSSGYQPADGPCFELCGDKVDEGFHKVDICVPVKPM